MAASESGRGRATNLWVSGRGPPIAWPWGEVAGPLFDQRVIVFIPADLQQCEKGKEKGVICRKLRVILVITAFK